MPDSFEFAVANPKVDLPATRTGETVVDLTSRLGRHARVGFDVQARTGAEAEWLGAPSPAETDLPDGETVRVTVPITVPAEAPAGAAQFTVRAYAVDNPQADFTESPTIDVTVPPVAAPKKGIPWWVFLIIGVVVVGVLGVAAKFLFFGGGGDVPNLIASPIADARTAADDAGVDLGEHSVNGVSSDGECVLLQTPRNGEGDRVDVLTVTCPPPAPSVQAPSTTVCEMAFGFCQAVAREFGDDFSTDERWLDAQAAMVQEFVDAFTVPGQMVPDVIGRSAADAEAAVAEAGFSADRRAETDNGSPSCVLLQYPFGDTLAADGATVLLVTVPCPGQATSPDLVAVSTSIDLDAFTNLCDRVEPFCAAIEADPALVDDVISNGVPIDTGLLGELTSAVVQFRNAFIDRVVPGVVGMRLSTAESTLQAAGLEAEYALPPNPNPYVFTCYDVASQNPPAGTDIDLLPDTDVALQLVESFCYYWPVEAQLIQDASLLESIEQP